MNGAPTHLPPIAAWGIHAQFEPLAGGHRNRVFRTSGTAQSHVFKSTRRSEAQLEWLNAPQEAARAAGFIVPPLARSRSGTLCVDGWTCERFVDGRSFEAAELTSLAAPLRAFHANTAVLEQRPDYVGSHEATASAKGGDIDLDALPNEIAQLCLLAWAGVPKIDTGAIHGDVTAANVLHTATGPALIDWDEARVDHRAYDLLRAAPETASPAQRSAALAWEVACSWDIENAHAQICAQALKRRF